MAYVGRDFDPTDTGERERFTLDFVNDLEAGDTILTAMWSCEVAAKSEMDDPNAASCIAEPAVFSGTKTTQRVVGMVPGVTYALIASITSAAGDTLSLWSHVVCKEPA